MSKPRRRRRLRSAGRTLNGGQHVALGAGFLHRGDCRRLFGFGGIAVASAGIAKILFLIFLIGFLITLVLGLAAGRRVPPI